MMRRVFAVLGLVVGFVLSGALPANAAHVPYGREFAWIVSHEMGHCLGAGHWSGYSIMRSGYSNDALASGAQPYAPTSKDLATMQASRVPTVHATSYVTIPARDSYQPVYNKTGRSAAFTAADRWDPGTSFTIYPVYSQPARGITIFWDWSLAYTHTSGVARTDMVSNGTGWQIWRCSIGVNPRIG